MSGNNTFETSDFADPRFSFRSSEGALLSTTVLLRKKIIAKLGYYCDILVKGLGTVSPAHFIYDFSTKIFLMLYPMTDQISLSGWLALLLEILSNMCIANVF